MYFFPLGGQIYKNVIKPCFRPPLEVGISLLIVLLGFNVFTHNNFSFIEIRNNEKF